MNASWRALQVTAIILAIAAPVAPNSANSSDTREWQFRVYLGDKEIGYHNFRLRDLGQARKLETEARFKVKVLFFNAYEYEHVNTEQWRNGCLQRIESRTNANGEEYFVEGLRRDGEFLISTGDEQVNLPPCVMTFAYWNPDFLDENRLLNAQTGEYVDISVETVTTEELTVRGQSVPAIRYSLTAEKLQLDLWYSQNREWLALQSTTDNGRRLRYELI